jgi:hypothetical protein
MLAASGLAQRRGGGGGSFGGRMGGGHSFSGHRGGFGRIGGGHGFTSHRGGFGRIGGGSVWRGGWTGGRHYWGGGSGFYRGGWGSRYGSGIGYWPYGWGFSAGYYSWPSYYAWPSYYDWGYSYPAYGAYSPGVNVVYAAPSPTPAVTTVYVERARPALREYDEFGQERRPAVAEGAEAPLYLIALRDGVIRAAVAYWVDGDTLHYVTGQKEQKSVRMDAVDRELSLQLNRERRVPFRLP